MNKSRARQPVERRDLGRPRGGPVESAILDETLAELATYGASGLRIERIAEAAEVNKTSIYRRWPTREALVRAALERVRDRLSSGLEDHGDLLKNLKAMSQAVAHLVQQKEGRALAIAAMTIAPESPLSEAPAFRIGGNAADQINLMTINAIKRGEWRAGASPPQVLALLVGAILHRVLLERENVDERWLDGIVELVANGIRPREPAAKTRGKK
jgi:AcrR family transcriptional regulator